ncbi:MAG: isoamylase early set domain-containing protein [Bacteroidales bacterium]|nr:isoamylase early set domain-containing protein [Bacteroidales bacterium]MBN2699669.1 isoamylase early set domain-containing protein [Bacteroidales bacterium]
MSLKKQYFEKKPSCKVTFRLSKSEANRAKRVNLVGDFNNWNQEGTPMKMLKNGDFTVILDLEKGKEYQFRYLLNGSEWINDTAADRYAVNEYQTENSVVIV